MECCVGRDGTRKANCKKSEAQLTKSIYILMNEYSVLWKKSAFSKEQIVGGRSSTCVRTKKKRKREAPRTPASSTTMTAKRGTRNNYNRAAQRKHQRTFLTRFSTPLCTSLHLSDLHIVARFLNFPRFQKGAISETWWIEFIHSFILLHPSSNHHVY